MDHHRFANPTMEQPNEKHRSEENLKSYDFAQFTDRLRFLYQQLTQPEDTLHEQFATYLVAGCQMLKCEFGFVVSSLGSVYRTITHFSQLSKELGAKLTETEEEIYRLLSERDNVNRGTQVISEPDKKAVEAYWYKASVNYYGLPLLVAGNKCGVICFVSRSEIELSAQDIETLELMAEGVARMIELQNSKDKNRIEEIRGFATAGVKSLEEYVKLARLPEVYGVSGRVVDVLERRIGIKPLAIDYVAEELNLSKRTLQRRLQQQNVSFAQLRDQVRFHHSIDFLVHQTMSIDAISAALDFSDRTSFTNAFKRWTALSPSTFRKLFRDYA